MKQENYHRCITADVTIQKAFECICNVAGWWATNITGNTGKLNDSFTVCFGKTFSNFKITELVQNEKIVWNVEESFLSLFKNEKQWNNTKIIWEISGDDNAAQICMTHVGLTPETECYSDCEKGWDFYIKESLFNLLTENKGLPGTGIFANIFIEGKKYEGLLYFKNDPLPVYRAGYIFIDVKETNGEQVISAFAANEYNSKYFNAAQINGEYFMILKDEIVYDNKSLLELISQSIKQGKVEQQNYQSSITANITAEEAFKNISHVSEWWTANFEGSSEKLNDTFRVSFGETFVTFKITEVIPCKRIVWLVTGCYLHWLNNKTEWNNTKIVWEISSENNSTKINFMHVGLIPEVECYDDCVKGWDHYITQSLFKLITENKGLPEKKKEIQTV